MASDLNRITNNTAVQMKDRNFSGKDSVSIIAFLPDFKAACDACNFHESTAVWLLKHYPNGPVRSVINAHVVLQTETARTQEGCLTFYSAIGNYLLKRHATDDNFAIVDADFRTFKQERLTEPNYA